MRLQKMGLTLVLAAGAVAVPAQAAPPPKPSCMDSAEGLAAAAAMARACGRRVEVGAGRTESSQVFVNTDGTSTMEMSAGPQRVRRGGSWTAIDTTLRKAADGSIAPGATLSDVRFSGGGNTPLVTLVKGKRQVTMAWPQALPAPTLNGDTATYAEVLPSVDLVVRATATGFTHVFVVKTAAAGSGPFDLVLGGTGVTLQRNGQGGVTAVGDDGIEVAHSGGAAMWDSAAQTGVSEVSSPKMAATGAREAKAAMAFTGNRLRITPDSALMGGKSTRFPVFVDPAWFDGVGGKGYSKWAYANGEDNTNDTDHARVGHNEADGALYRSFFEFPTSSGSQTLVGARIISASFSIKLYHSWSCAGNPTPVSVYRTGSIVSNPRTNWTPSLAAYLDTKSASANKASCYVAAEPTMTFGNLLTADLQAAATAGWTKYTIGVTARDANQVNESVQDHWKKFYTSPTLLIVNYNHAPTTSALTAMSFGDPTVGATYDCGPSPVIVNAANGLLLNAKLTDSDGDNLKAVWAVSGINASHVPPATAMQASGTEFLSTTIAAAAFTSGSTYSWSVSGHDGTDPGQQSPSCPFTVDNSTPNAPSADTVNAELALGTGLLVPDPKSTAITGVAASVPLKPAVGDTNIAGYLIGVSTGAPPQPSIWIPAKSDGTAVASVVPLSSTATNFLTVKARSLTGQLSGLRTYKFKANAGPGAAHVPGDATGDQRPDITVLNDAGGGNSALWRWASNGSGGVLPPTAPQDLATVYSTAGTIAVNGDFDGDGLSDVATFSSLGATGVSLSVQQSNANSLLGSQVWSATTGGWAFASMKVVVGNFDGDGGGRDDLAVLHNVGGNNWNLWVFVATGSAGSTSFAAPIVWDKVTNGTSNWNLIKIVAADVNGDGKSDIVQVYNRAANAHTQMFQHLSTGSAFTYAALRWDSGVGKWYWDNSTFFAADFNGDGKQDMGAFYRFGNCVTGLYVNVSKADATGAGNAWTSPWTSAGGDWCGDKIQPVVGDFNGDAKADIVTIYRCCGLYQSKLHLFAGNGNATFNAPAYLWEGGTGPLGSGSIALDTTGTVHYQIKNVQSGKCVTVPGSPPSTADYVQLVQSTCVAGAGQRFLANRVGPASIWFRMTHGIDLCIDLDHALAANGTKIQQFWCNNIGNGGSQYFQVEYINGLSNPVVRIVNRANGTCVQIAGGSLAEGALVQNYACNGSSAQVFELIRVV